MIEMMLDITPELDNGMLDSPSDFEGWHAWQWDAGLGGAPEVCTDSAPAIFRSPLQGTDCDSGQTDIQPAFWVFTAQDMLEAEGISVSTRELIALATENGWITADGMSLASLECCLTYFGADAAICTQATMTDLSDELEQGHQVTVQLPVNGETVLVRVLEIDISDADNPQIRLDFAGDNDTEGFTIPYDGFSTLWDGTYLSADADGV